MHSWPGFTELSSLCAELHRLAMWYSLQVGCLEDVAGFQSCKCELSVGTCTLHYLRLLIICVQVIYIEISRYIQTEL
jgi:hypothetical protein